jgi:peptide/nickel transport system permease protein
MPVDTGVELGRGMTAVSTDVSRDAAPKKGTTGARVPILRQVMRSYILRRILRAIFVIWVVATGVFFLLRLLPGNPVDVYINQQISQYGMTYDQAAASAAALFSFDPGTPLLRQYLDYLVGLLQGDMGMSILSPGTTVVEKIALKLPWTLFSVGVSIAIAIAVGLVLGMIMAYRRGGVLDHGISVIGSVLHAIPNYLLAIMIVVIFAVQLQWVDLGAMRGHVTPGVTWESHGLAYISDIFYHATLPMITYVLTTAGSWALVMKYSTTQVLGEDYVTVAQARGLPEARIRFAYVGRNAVLPLVAQIAVQAAFVVGGAIFVEQTFSYDGVGTLLFQSLQARDYPVLQGVLLVITATVVIANLVADLIYGVLDPRIRTSEVDD